MREIIPQNWHFSSRSRVDGRPQDTPWGGARTIRKPRTQWWAWRVLRPLAGQSAAWRTFPCTVRVLRFVACRRARSRPVWRRFQTFPMVTLQTGRKILESSLYLVRLLWIFFSIIQKTRVSTWATSLLISIKRWFRNYKFFESASNAV